MLSISESEYSDIIGSCRWSTFFGTVAWLKVLRDSFGYKYKLLGITVKGKKIVLPIVTLRKRLLLFSEYVSVPFEDYGGFFSKSELDKDDIAFALRRLRKIPTLDAMTLAPGPEMSGLYPVEYKSAEKFTHIIDTSRGYEQLFEELYSQKCRNKIRKAVKNGVRVKFAESIEDYQEYAGIYEDSARRWGGAPFFKRDFFENLYEYAREHTRIYLAEYNGKKVAGVLNFQFNGYLYNFSSCYLSGFARLAAVNLLQDFAIKETCAKSDKLYDFGGSVARGTVLDSVIKFKESFGAKKIVFNKYLIRGKMMSGAKSVKDLVQGGTT